MIPPNRIHTLHHMPTVEAVRANARRRVYHAWIGAILLAAICTVMFVAVTFGNVVVPLVLIMAVMIPILFWRYPLLSTYSIFAAACLIEVFPTNFPDAVTDRLPLFQDVNTIVQRFTHSDFHALPINLFELILLVALAVGVLRGVFLRTTNLRLGPTFAGIFVYICFVGWGEVRGMTSGGDLKISLLEIRAQFYFLMAYLIAVNNIKTPKQINTLYWVSVICIGIKGILYTFRRYVTLHGQPLPDQGVGSHEEAFFFDNVIVLLLIFSLCGVQQKLRLAIWILLIPIVLGDLATNRRSATAAVLIIVPVLLLAAYQGLPGRRKVARNLGIALIIAFLIYYPAFRNSSGMIGEPARAIKSQLEPDKRDKDSDQYRLAEEADLWATIKSTPITGYGYGKEMFHAVPIADISKAYPLWDIMTHNQILWVWMRVGGIGFIAFWCMISAIIMQACRVLRASDDPDVKSTAIFVACTTGMLLMFGLFDLQLSNYRDMLFVGYWAGVCAGLPVPNAALLTGRAGPQGAVRESEADAERPLAGVGLGRAR